MKMNLKDYYKNNNSETSEFQRMNIYNQFLEKSSRVSLHKKVSFYVRIGIYSVFVFFLSLSLYIPFLNNGIFQGKDKKIAEQGTGYMIKQPVGSGNRINNKVYANNIGKIIKSKGKFKIEKDGKIVDTKVLSDGDIITLFEDSSISFKVATGSIGNIKGPAKFKINHFEEGENKYVLNLLEGEYFEVSSSKDLSKNISIKAEDFNIEPQKNNNLDVVLQKKDQGRVIENQGGNIKVTNSNSDNKKEVSNLKAKEKAIFKDNKLELLQEVRKISKDIKEKNISKTYDISEDEQSSGKDISNVQESDYSSGDIKEGKNVLSPDKFERLKDLTHLNFLEKDIKNIVINYLLGEISAYEISYKNLFSRIEKIYSVFGYEEYSKTVNFKESGDRPSIDNIYLLLDQLLARISNDYYIPDNTMNKLEIALAWSVILKENEFGKFKGEKLDFQEIFNRLNLSKYEKDLSFR